MDRCSVSVWFWGKVLGEIPGTVWFYKHEGVKNKHLHWYENYSGWWIYLCLFLTGIREKYRMVVQAWMIKEHISVLVWNYCGWWICLHLFLAGVREKLTVKWFYKLEGLKDKHLHWYVYSPGWWTCLCLLLADFREKSWWFYKHEGVKNENLHWYDNNSSW